MHWILDTDESEVLMRDDVARLRAGKSAISPDWWVFGLDAHYGAMYNNGPHPTIGAAKAIAEEMEADRIAARGARQ